MRIVWGKQWMDPRPYLGYDGDNKWSYILGFKKIIKASFLDLRNLQIFPHNKLFHLTVLKFNKVYIYKCYLPFPGLLFIIFNILSTPSTTMHDKVEGQHHLYS